MAAAAEIALPEDRWFMANVYNPVNPLFPAFRMRTSPVSSAYFKQLRSCCVTLLMALACCLVGGITPRTASAAEPAFYRRWAILATPAVQETGLADQLTAELTSREGIDLVERDQIVAATRELELDALLGSGTTAGRLKLGQLLKADALIWLSFDTLEGSTCLKFAASECSYGARLRIEVLHWEQEATRPSPSAVADLVDEVLASYPSGVKRIIGLAPFLSQNLEHAYDHLQSEYAHLVEAGLSGVGLAVIDVEEAEAIRRELVASREQGGGRNLPLMVDGEFKMRRSEGTAEPKVELSVRIRASGAPRVVRQTIALANVPSFLGQELSKSILVIADQQSAAIPVPEQIRWLATRADRFTNVGAWHHAAGMREAAILLAPNSLDQSLLLIAD